MPKPKRKPISQRDARTLAVAYEAVLHGCRLPDEKRNRLTWESQRFWAKMLRDAQDKTGVKLLSTCDHLIATAGVMIDQINRIEQENDNAPSPQI